MALRALQGPAGGTAPVGTLGGTTDTIPRWTGPSTLGDSLITQSGSLLGVNKAVPTSTFDVDGLQANTGATSASSPTGTTRLNYAGGAASGNFGASLVFSQQWNAGNPTSYVAVGQIAGVKTQGSGFYGGGLAFFYGPNGSNQLLEAFRYDNAGNVGIGTASITPIAANYTTVSIRGSSGGGIQMGTAAAQSYLYGDAGRMELGTTPQIPLLFTTWTVPRMRISGAGATEAASQVAIGTSSFTTGRALTTVADLDVFGVRVGRGANTSSTANAVLGNTALDTGTSADYATAIGAQAIQRHNGSENTGVGYLAHRGSTTLANNTGGANTAVGSQALTAISSGGSNVAIGRQAGDSITTGNSNIVIGSGADVAAAGDSNQLVLGDATNYVATNGGATTYYATAGASLGYMRVRLNGTYVKIEVFADV